MPFTSLSNSHDKSSIRRQELKKAFSDITDAAGKENVDLLLICGDLYEHDYIKRSTLHFVCSQFEKIRDISVIIIPGNHDPLVPGCGYKSIEWPPNVHILSDGCCFRGLEDKEIRVYSGIPAEAPFIGSPYINIIMLHGTPDMPFDKGAYNHVSCRELSETFADYIALGHFHTMKRAAGEYGNIFNPGSPEPLGFDEEGSHGFFLVSINKTSSGKCTINADFIERQCRSYKNIRLDVSGCRSDEEIIEKALKLKEINGSREDLVNLTLNGYVSQDFRIDTRFIADSLSENIFFIRVYDETVPDFDFESIARSPGLRGLFVSRMLKNMEKATDNEEKAMIMKALYYGMEAIDRGEIL